MKRSVCPRHGRLAHNRKSGGHSLRVKQPGVIRRLLYRLCRDWRQQQRPKQRGRPIPVPVVRELRKQAIASTS